MAWVAANPARYAGQVVGTGHCVALIQTAAHAPHTRAWRRGSKVRGGNVPTGTAIATFGKTSGKYENKTDGSSHAAIFIEEQSGGISVFDQWLKHPTAQRLIRFKGGVGTANNDADQFYVVESAADFLSA